jgi:DNA-binding GntR family transcriptional regulator
VTIGATHRPLRETVLAALREAIIDGQYAQGERLVEEEIAARFAVSRNPIRDALHVLAVEGLVALEPRRGARVGLLDAVRARDLFEVRAPLEGLVARLAAERRTDEQLAELGEIVARGQHAGETGRLERLPALNTAFHSYLAGAAGNSLLASTLGHLSDLIRWAYASRIRLRWEESWREHALIADAVAAGDPDRAYDVGLAHIANAAATYLER